VTTTRDLAAVMLADPAVISTARKPVALMMSALTNRLLITPYPASAFECTFA